MQIVPQSVELLAMTPDPVGLIERCGRICYKSEDKMKKYVPCKKCNPGGSVQEDDEGCVLAHSDGCNYCKNSGYFTGAEAFALAIMERGHESVLEHASATMLFITDRGMTHELVRHRLCAFSQESTRYCNYGNANEITVVQPALACRSGAASDTAWMATMRKCEDTYLELIENGVAPQHARSVLPTCLKTEIAVTANFRQWRHMIGLRLLDKAGKAHPQIKELFTMALNHFMQSSAWCIFNDLYVYSE